MTAPVIILNGNDIEIETEAADAWLSGPGRVKKTITEAECKKREVHYMQMLRRRII